MKGDPEVLKVLNEVLTGELTAINQYFLHAAMCKDWGYTKLAAHVHAESIDEMKHAQALIERILYLGGVPNVQRLGSIQIGKTVKAQLENDLALEHEALPRLNTGIETLRGIGDTGSRLLLEQILASEEAHVEWLEAQLALVEQVGLENYLAAQIREEG